MLWGVGLGPQYVFLSTIAISVGFMLNNSQCPTYWGNNIIPGNDVSFQGLLTYIELKDFGLNPTNDIEHNYGLCMQTFVSYENGRLNVTIVCNTLNEHQKQSSTVIQLDVANKSVKYVLFDEVLEVLICDPSRHRMGGIAVNAYEQLLIAQYSNLSQATYDSVCNCTSHIEIIAFLNYAVSVSKRENEPAETSSNLRSSKLPIVCVIVVIVTAFVSSMCCFFL